MEHCKPVSTPMEQGRQFHDLPEEENPVNVREYQKIIGCLTYATTATRPDLSSAVNILSKFMSRPGKEHWEGVKRVLRYIQGTINYGFMFQENGNEDTLVGYSDADCCNVSWCSKRQLSVSKSSTETEYIALSLATQEAAGLCSPDK